MAHLHSVYDTDLHFKIDAITRVITNQATQKTKLIQYDHNSERFTFEIPRYVDGHDMMLCNEIRVHFINAGSARDQRKDVYPVYDAQLSPADSKVVIFSWLISQNATRYAGTLNFLVQFSCVQDDGTIDYTWHTDIYKGITVSTGMSNGDAIASEVSDVISQWEQELFGVGDTEEQRLKDAGTEQLAAITAKAELVLDSIPEDYTETHNMADESLRTKADAIVQTKVGEYIVASDSSEDHLRGLRVFGKSVQDPSPTPTDPHAIRNVGSVTVGVYGKNLMNTSYVETGSNTVNGITFVLNPDMSITCDGTATEAALFNLMTMYEVTPVIRPGGTYIISGATQNVAMQVYEWQNKWVLIASTNDWKQFTLSKNAAGILIRYVINPGLTVNNVTVRPMLYSVDVVDTAYEKPVFGQILNCTSVNELRGIPVYSVSDGNYIDSNGQSWLVDEIDFGRGVHIQRVGVIEFDGSDDEYWDATPAGNNITLYYIPISNKRSNYVEIKNALLCSHFAVNRSVTNDVGYINETYYKSGNVNILVNYDNGSGGVAGFKTWLHSNPITVYYVLKTPIETSLSDTEIAAYRKIHANYPNTTVLNTVGATMEVSYNADTKLHLRNEAERIVAEVLEGVVNGSY